MTIYKRNKEHIKIWKKHNGAIPKDNDGRSYEIHHIDGDHKNNSIENLKLVTIQEHYEIHLQQNDWAACLLISSRMKINPEKKSELARNFANQQIVNGTHPWQGGEHQRKWNKRRLEDGTHPWLGEKNPVHTQLENGTHIFLGGKLQKVTNAKRIANGTHHWLGGHEQSRINKIRVENGTHNFSNPAKITCPHCGLESIKNGNMTRWHFDKCKSKP